MPITLQRISGEILNSEELKWKCVQTIFFEIRGYFEISVFEISRDDYIR